ncbi:BnaC02g24840D [Brassica napus]|uniref:BnaC02g24840D protein n=1 Tax=Brassica napus TaxID=3708 RepID=A0A078FP09_BRANA|nr:BnaC02g24840D [Brassica napus]
MDAFDAIPDPVGHRHSEQNSLLLQLDQIGESDSEKDSAITSFFRSLFKSVNGFFPIFSKPAKILTPVKILAGFDQIRNLDVKFYGGDFKLEKGAAVKWKAEFGESLKSCVIVAFRSATVNTLAIDGDAETDSEFVSGLKTRVVWTISALMAASTRHYQMRDLVKEHKEMEKLTVRDRDGEGATEARGDEKVSRERTVVPNVRMSMRNAPSLKLKSGICLEAATLVVVRPSGVASDDEDAELATGAFGFGDCMYGEAVAALLKRRRNVLEMNSF